MSSTVVDPRAAPSAGAAFDWPLCHDAEQLVRRHVEGFLRENGFADRLAQRMAAETGTDFFEWIDHLMLGPAQRPELEARGFVAEDVDAPAGAVVLAHPRAMLPRIVIAAGARRDGVTELALRVESVADFIAAHDLGVAIEGAPGARLRRAEVASEPRARLAVVERLGSRGHCVREPAENFLRAALRAREEWRTRRRGFPDDADGIAEAFERLERVLALVDREAACELFFAEERAYWEARNGAARIQKRRQDQRGLGWANHDHHTFRSSRERFSDLMRFLQRLGFRKRERYYAGAEAGWGAQILEQDITGIVVFADVDLMPDETEVDFSAQRLPAATRLGTVGLWCALHGDSFLQAGMHHLEARFDFLRLREQLDEQGVKTMKPFSDFDFLRQAFTEGERWRVRPERVARLEAQGLITREQAEGFRRDGAIGSHLENLQRKGGFKGFNQKSVSAIIAATDPRKMQATH